MIIDTHAHLYYPELSENINEIIDNALQSGIKKIIVPAIDIETTEKILKLTAIHDIIYAVIGFHPCDITKLSEKDFQTLENYLNEDKVVGIGETGLDYYWDKTYKDKQIDFFKRHLELSEKYDLPVVIHTRDSIKDAISIIADSSNKCSGQFHCFSGDEKDLEDVLNFNSYFVSFCGNITYKNFVSLSVVKNTPLEKLLAETDSPFLTPIPHRGKKNQPAFVVNTIKKIAEIKNIDLKILEDNLEANTRILFKKAF
ncbi:MAG: TatD family hydrolase [Candidatus Kapaibacterium sp.]